MSPNEREHYPIPPLGVELGLWPGIYQNIKLPWLRWWDDNGKLLPTPGEKADIFAARLRELGVNPDEL